jgi:predicted nucleotidyltransferase
MSHVAKKPEMLHELRQVKYDPNHWDHLRALRSHAVEILRSIESISVNPYVYGSVARGDISKSSDIDIIIPHQVSSYRLELVLGQTVKKELVQATPSMVLKGHIHLPENTVVSFPLFKMRQREEEFYRWGGIIDSSGLEKNVRVPGVDKRLILIEPTDFGHSEHGVIGHESATAKRLGVSNGIAQERVRVLSRRDSVGRTGVYLTRELDEGENFEEVAKKLRDSDPALRRTMEKREGKR